MKTLVYDRWARSEVQDAAKLYEIDNPRIAQKSRETIEETGRRIVLDPESYPRIMGALRSLRVPEFPYVMVYHIVDDSTVKVVAVAHVSRRPGYWAKRS